MDWLESALRAPRKLSTRQSSSGFGSNKIVRGVNVYKNNVCKLEMQSPKMRSIEQRYVVKFCVCLRRRLSVFFENIIIWDESRFFEYDSKIKRQSNEWREKESSHARVQNKRSADVIDNGALSMELWTLSKQFARMLREMFRLLTSRKRTMPGKIA